MLIAFSGLDSSGKSTLIQCLSAELAGLGHRPAYIWSRAGYTAGMHALKRLASRFSRRRTGAGGRPVYPARASSFAHPGARRLWLALALLDLIRLYALQCRWYLWQGRTVLCDRYLPDVLIDMRLNFPEERVETWWLWRLLQRLAVTPDRAFVMLIPPSVSIQRSEQRGRDFSERMDILHQRAHAYGSLAKTHGYPVLDGRLSVEDLLHAILTDLNSVME